MKNAEKILHFCRGTQKKWKITYGKLFCWLQIIDIVDFNRNFRRKFLNISNTGEAELIYNYTRGLENRVWKKLCLRNLGKLWKSLKEAEKLKPHIVVWRHAHPFIDLRTTTMISAVFLRQSITLIYVSPEKREECIKGLFLGWHQKSHLAKYCSKEKRG